MTSVVVVAGKSSCIDSIVTKRENGRFGRLRSGETRFWAVLWRGRFAAYALLVGVGEEVHVIAYSLSFRARWSRSATFSSVAHLCK